MQNAVDKPTAATDAAPAEILHPATVAAAAKASKGQPKTRAAKVKEERATKPAAAARPRATEAGATQALQQQLLATLLRIADSLDVVVAQLTTTPTVASQPAPLQQADAQVATQQAEAALPPPGLPWLEEPVRNTAADLRPLPATGKEGQQVEGEAAGVVYASTAIREEIIRRLNHPVVTIQEKTKMLLNINRLTQERAEQALEKLNNAIKDREEGR